MNNATFPGWPKASASAAIFKGDSVLIVKSGKVAHNRMWTLPGGHIEAGETSRAAALREVMEETGVEVRLDGLVDVVDVIRATEGVLTAHYLLVVFHGQWLAGEPVAATDVTEARFVPVDELGSVTLLAGNADVIHQAWALARKDDWREV